MGTPTTETPTPNNRKEHTVVDDTRKQVLDLILKSEGGLNEDEPEHVGGVSYAGITQQAYDGLG